MSTVTTKNIAEAIDALNKRIHRLEQLSTSGFAYRGDGHFESITIGGKVKLDLTSSPPTGLVLSSVAFFDDIIIDADWQAPLDGSAIEYIVDLALKNPDGTYQLQQSYNTGGTSMRMHALRPNTTYGVRVQAFNHAGVMSVTLPETGYQDITTAVDATVPPPVTGVTLSRGATSAVVKFTPLTKEQAPDVANGHGLYEIELHTNATFTALLRSKHTSDQITAFNDIISEIEVWARVRAIDDSGNAGPWTAAVAGLAVGAVGDNMILAGLDAAKITVGFLDGTRIQADTIDANRIKSSALTTQTLDLAGGQFRVLSGGTTGSTAMLINSQGISLFDPAGTRKIFLNAATGTGSFEGDISASTVTASEITGSDITGGTISGALFKTAFSGKRIQIQSDLSLGGVVEFHADDSGSIGNLAARTGREIYLSAGHSSDTETTVLSLFRENNAYSTQPFVGILANFFQMLSATGSGRVAIAPQYSVTDGQAVYCVSETNDAFVDCGASAFITASKKEFKKDVEVAQLDGLASVRAVLPKTYKLKDAKPEESKKLGFVAEDLPVDVRTVDGYSLNGLVAHLWKAVQQNDQRITAIERDTQ